VAPPEYHEILKQILENEKKFVQTQKDELHNSFAIIAPFQLQVTPSCNTTPTNAKVNIGI
jgi:hypothetical protein